MFKPVPTRVDFPDQERRLLGLWRETNVFDKLRRKLAGGPRWSFIDGPITANNPMGVHHAWGRTYKDLYQRYKAMQGFDQRWQNGYDCQGLWVEVNVERELGFQSKKDIEAYGLASFVRLCKSRVLHFAAVQTQQSIRLGYQMDWNDPDTLESLAKQVVESPEETITLQGPRGPVTDSVEQVVGRLGLPELGGSYFTFSNENNYQIWSFLKSCHERGWIYKGRDVMPWCARCATGISQHEIVTEGYIERTDPGLTVHFPLRDRPGESLLVWTTTPWTLTSNVAAAVGPSLTYARVKQGERVFYLSKGCLHALTGPYEVLGELNGAAMEGWTYDGPFDELPAQQSSGSAAVHRVILWKDVGEEEGTGIVHIAPGCGAEDFQLGRQFLLPALAPLDEFGVFMADFGWLAGMDVSEVTAPIVEDLKRKDRFYRLEDYTHRYPECWRCHTPLVFRLVDEWFISMGPLYDKPDEQVSVAEKDASLRYQMMDSVNQIRWIPAFGYEREMEWLHNMHDWMISKKRYWGLALPIWVCESCGNFDVMGSREELAARAIEGWETFEGHTPHRPWIDAVKIACSKCGAKASRIADVGNPWLDAGIVAHSTLGYRTDRAYWAQWFPADLISESFPGQFRNWFYSLIAMSTGLERQSPCRAVFSYGTLLAEDGSAMHKSAGNMIEFNEAADTAGVDVMRWAYCCQRPEADMLFGYHVMDDVRRRFLIPLWNVYSFFVMYANVDAWTPEEGRPAELSVLDHWITARLSELVAQVTASLDDYDAMRAAQAVELFMDDLSNWYVRRSRRRFWKSEADSDKNAAYSTLYGVLMTLIRLLAPFVPFVTEEIYQNLVRGLEAGDPEAGVPESVHLCDWPHGRTLTGDERVLLADMAAVRQAVTLGHATRASSGVKVRQPLSRVMVVADPAQKAGIERLVDILTDELNVKTVEFVEREQDLVSYQLLPDNRKLGPKFGKQFPALRAALSALDPVTAAHTLRAGQALQLTLDGQPVELLPDEVLVQATPREGLAVQAEGGVVVALDIHLTPALVAEGLAREIVRRIQTMRKDAGFDLADRIETSYQAEGELAQAIEQWADYIQAETLSLNLEASPAPAGEKVESFKLDGQPVMLGVKRRT
ncbi:MAG: isoleucine--tRNA ligase [Thermoflexales bacterium]|nr:isoleucine--tRNA ligase [Thermoflexales bacterium]